MKSALPIIRLLEGAADEAIRHISTESFNVHDASVAIFGEAARAMTATIGQAGGSARVLSEAAKVITAAENQGLSEFSLAAITKTFSEPS